jgi:hypothetical protein
MKPTWSVAVLYDDVEAREAATVFCDQLVQKFWAEFQFDVSWWPFTAAKEPRAAKEAAKKAAQAELLIFAPHPDREIPPELVDWVELWLTLRGRREGAMARTGTASTHAGARNELYLRNVAHRAGVDYLTDVPQTIRESIPESPESCTARAEQMTSVLDEILHHSPRAGKFTAKTPF